MTAALIQRQQQEQLAAQQAPSLLQRLFGQQRPAEQGQLAPGSSPALQDAEQAWLTEVLYGPNPRGMR